MAFLTNIDNYLDDLLDRFRSDNEEIRREERRVNLEREATVDEPDVGTGTTVEAATENEISGPAKVLKVDFKAGYNAVNHHCEKYELVSLKEGTPVLRRGGTFSIDVTLNRNIDLKKSFLMKLYFNFGPAPNVHKGTQAVLTVTGKVMMNKSHEDWDVRVASQEGRLLTLEVQIPTDAPIGTWRCAVELRPQGNPDPNNRQLLRLETLIYILFNPWNKHDATYLHEEEKRQEYVLNDVGKIWQGGYPARGRHWVYGQFDDAVLPASVLLLERSGMLHELRGDPIFVSRTLSKMVNSNDDSGVLVGRWDGEYGDGKSPSHWSGSIAILEEYVRRNRPVRYGQCWVFAGVLNTVCRALGLPARVITNLNSAHDTDVSLTIDEYVDAEGKEITGYRPGHSYPPGLSDSIWNFHVWNDVWMTRPDLPVGYGGWQAIDSTPQETSDGVFQCGPASHEAIRRGQMEHKYDVPFVLAEVNADVMHWQEDPDAPDGYRKLYSNKNHVGRQLLTKRVGRLQSAGYSTADREDCTALYKPQEGTRAERVTLHTAARRSRAARHAFRFPSLAVEDVDFTIEDVERVPIGKDFTMTIRAENTNDREVRTISIVMRIGSTYYTGAPAHPITEVADKIVLQPKQAEIKQIAVPYHRYYNKLVEHAMVKMVAHCKVEETSYAWVGDDCFEVMKPDVQVEVLTEPVAGGSFQAKFSFRNPLPLVLKNCVLVVDGPNLTRPKTVPISDVAAEGDMSYTLRLYPSRPGNFVLVSTFNSTQLLNLTGSTNVTVSEP